MLRNSFLKSIGKDISGLHFFMEGPDGPKRAGTPIVSGILFLSVCWLVCHFLPPFYAAIILGVLVASVVCFVVLMAMPRGTQISIMGAAVGVSADAGYAKFNDETPITVANALVKLADSLTKGMGLITTDAHVNVNHVTPSFVWAFIFSTIVFMGLSFLVKHDG